MAHVIIWISPTSLNFFVATLPCETRNTENATLHCGSWTSTSWRRTDGQTDRDRQTDGRTDGQTDRQIDTRPWHIPREHRSRGKNAQNGDGLGWIGVTQGYRQCHHSIDGIRLGLIETMRLSCTVFEIRRVICRNSPTSTYPTCIWRRRWGWLRLNFEKIFGIRKLESLGYRAALFACSYV